MYRNFILNHITRKLSYNSKSTYINIYINICIYKIIYMSTIITYDWSKHEVFIETKKCINTYGTEGVCLNFSVEGRVLKSSYDFAVLIKPLKHWVTCFLGFSTNSPRDSHQFYGTSFGAGASCSSSSSAAAASYHRHHHHHAPCGPNPVQPCRMQGPPPPLLPVGWSEDSCEIVSSLKILECSSTQVVALRWPEKDFCNCKMYEMFYNYTEEHQEFSFERNYYIATILLVHDDFQLWYSFIILWFHTS